MATPAVREFAAIRTRDAEQKAHQVFEKHGMSVPVQVEKEDVGEEKRYQAFPHIKFSSWVRYLLDSGRLSRQLCACENLEYMQVLLQEFWDRFEHIYPFHKIFAMRDAGTVDLKLVIPIYSHTDEGRTLKKQPLWLLSSHGVLGRGTRAYLRKGKHSLPLKRCGMGLNFCGHTWSTNFPFSSMHRKFFRKNPAVLDRLISIYAKDMEKLLTEGVLSSDGLVRVRCCHLGTKGDWPALVKVGNMKYSFSHVPRSYKSKTACQGICWMCRGGQEENVSENLPAIPFEETSGKPLWENSLGERCFWHTPPAMLEGVPLEVEDAWQFFKPDIWHCFHLGVAKHWVASAFVSFMETLALPQNSMEDRFGYLNSEYQDFCVRKRVSPHSEELGRDTFNWLQSSATPVGSWSKGAQSTHFMLFLEDFCKRWSSSIRGDPLLEAIVLGICFIKCLFAWFGPSCFFWNLLACLNPFV